MTAAFDERANMSIREQAVASVCARIDKQKTEAFGVDDAFLAQIVMMLIGQFLKCFGNETSTKERTRRRVEKKTNTPKKRARFVDHTEAAIQDQYQDEYGTPLPDDVAEDIANALIDECLAASDDHVEAVAAEFGS